MSDGYFVEHGEYLCWCWAAQMKNEKWHAYVSFEKKADHHKEIAPNMRHRLKDEFDSEIKAMNAASEHAAKLSKEGGPGF